MHMVKIHEIHEIHETQSAQISQKQDDHIILCKTKKMYPPSYHHDGYSCTPHYCVPSAGVTIMVIAGIVQCFHVT